MKTLLRTLLGVSPAEEVRRARTEMIRTRHERGADSRATAEEVRAAMAARGEEPHVTLGQATGGMPYHLALHTLRGAHGWVSGSTGSGKTTLAAHLVGGLQALQLAGAPISIIVLGLQGNFVELTLDAFAANLGRVPPARAAAALEQLLVARFFRGDFVPAWNLLARAPGVPSLLQANALAEVLENSLGSAMGHRQDTALAMLLALAIDEGLTLPELRLHLAFPEAFARRGATASDPIVRSYFGNRFLKEGPATLDGLERRPESRYAASTKPASRSAKRLATTAARRTS